MIYKTAIFDFDGTIMDTSEGIINCTNEIVKKHNIKVPPNADFKKIIGPPLKVAFMNVLGVDEDQSKMLVEEYVETRKKNYSPQCHVYEGIIDILKLFNENKINCAIASVKRQALVLDTLKHFNMEHYFKAVCGSKNDESVVDKISIIKDAISIMDAKKENTLMIGDSEYDCNGAKVVGIDFCAVLWGFGYYNAHEVTNAKYIIKKSEELRNIFGL